MLASRVAALTATVLVACAAISCVVETQVTGRGGYLCGTDGDCDPGLVCSNVDGERRCAQPSTAADAGADPAPEGPAADQGTCTGGPICVKGSQVQACAPDGSFAPVEACPAGMGCLDGTCIEPGDISATVRLTLLVHGDGDDALFATFVDGRFYRDAGAPPTEGFPGTGRCSSGGAGDRQMGTGFDAGPVRIEGLPGGERRVLFDVAEGRYHVEDDPVALATAGEPPGGSLRVQGGGQNLIGAFDVTAAVPPRRLLDPLDGPLTPGRPLTLSWSGATQEGTVYITGQTGAGGSPSFTCGTPDTGTFELPGELTRLFAEGTDPNGALALAVGAVQIEPLSADGVDRGTVFVQVLHFLPVELAPPP